MINPIFASDKFSNIIDNVLNSSLSDIIGADFVSDSPSVNIIESDAQHNIRVAAPGLQKTDFNITVDKDHLIVSTESEVENTKKEKSNYLRREFSYSNFKRSFHLPETIDRENISASYIDGILDITIAKKNIKKEDKGRTVDIV